MDFAAKIKPSGKFKVKFSNLLENSGPDHVKIFRGICEYMFTRNIPDSMQVLYFVDRSKS